MRLVTALIVILIPAQLCAVDVRKAAGDYPSQIAAPDMTAGVEYMVTTFSAEGKTFTIDDHLILEVGIFPKGDAKVDLRRFSLRINGKRIVFAQTPGMVAASVKYPDWTRKPSIQAAAGPIILGRPESVGRFPGDPTARYPRRDPAPQQESEKPQIDYGELIQKSALPEGAMNRPVAGLIYFPYDGKLKSIRTVELLLDNAVLKLR